MAAINRRDWLRLGASGLAGAALARGATSATAQQSIPPLVSPRAKRIVYLFMAGGVSQLETFDPKPGLADLRNTEIPASVLGNRRITTMTAGQNMLAVANALVGFQQYGESGIWVSDLFPHIAGVADDLCVLRTVYSDAVNHDPATNLVLTGSQLSGKPSLGAWVSMALGSANPSLPSYVVMQSQTDGVAFVQPLGKRLWSSAFLPAANQGVALRPGDRPVLYLKDELGLPETANEAVFNTVRALNEQRFAQVADPQILQRNDAYDIARAMQSSITDLADTSSEPEEVFELYGPESRVPGSFAANCLRARRLLERDVRSVMLFHRGWDNHYNLTAEMKLCAADTDQPTAALITDLKRLGLLEDTLVIWGGEFGRTAYSQGDITNEDHGRDHHAYSFSMLLAGGGVKGGTTYGETDDFSYNIVKDPVHIHDLHATVLHLLGVDHEKLTFNHEGRDHRLTDLSGRIIEGILA